jgi:hypothetical protein
MGLGAGQKVLRNFYCGNLFVGQCRGKLLNAQIMQGGLG